MDTLEYFRQICNIPRESGKEEGIRCFLLSWASEHGFEAVRDASGNIIVRIPATPGYENVPSVALQGHMDMVCVKTDSSEHDFSKDPIETYVDGDWLKAKDTSLGGDDGMAVAMVMALFTDPDAAHGPLEGIFTWDEETGMTGANNLDASLVRSKLLINLDSEEEGTIFTGCAGGVSVHAGRTVQMCSIPQDWETVRIKVEGLKGGHSGGEIHKQRLNATSALARMIHSIDESGFPFMISSFNGGVRSNIIPYSASCVVSFPKETKKQTMTRVLQVFQDIKNENATEEPDITETHHCTQCDESLKEIKTAASLKDSREIINALYLCPHGVHKMSKVIKGVVETSDNLAISSFSDTKASILVSIRSNIESSKKDLAQRIAVLFTNFGFDVSVSDSYPAWTPDPDSKLAALCAETWKNTTGEDAVITAIHAGLECGIINSRILGMESVSLGPTIQDAHSVNEKISISSTEKTYRFVCNVLKSMKA